MPSRSQSPSWATATAQLFSSGAVGTTFRRLPSRQPPPVQQPVNPAATRFPAGSPGSSTGWSGLVLQHGAEGAAADLPENRIIFGVGREHDREVQRPASG